MSSWLGSPGRKWHLHVHVEVSSTFCSVEETIEHCETISVDMTHFFWEICVDYFTGTISQTVCVLRHLSLRHRHLTSAFWQLISPHKEFFWVKQYQLLLLYGLCRFPRIDLFQMNAGILSHFAEVAVHFYWLLIREYLNLIKWSLPVFLIKRIQL